MIYAKLGGIVLACLLLFGGGYHFGGMASATKLEGFREAQAENTATAVLAERASAATELARVNTALKEYRDAPIDPIVPGIAHRVYIYASAAGCPVPSAPAVASGTAAPAKVTIGPSEVERRLGDYIAACNADAAQMIPMLKLAPQ